MSKTLSTTDVASLMGVAVKSVQNWIDQGKLHAGRTPGGHRRIGAKHLVAFLHRQNLPIPRELVSSTVRLLIIDEDPKLFRSLLSKLRSLRTDWEIQTTYHLFAAGQLCESYQPSVVWVNLAMAGDCALDITRKIRQAEATQYCMIVGFTNRMDAAIKRKCLQAGATACLPVETEPAVLVSMIEQWLDQ